MQLPPGSTLGAPLGPVADATELLPSSWRPFANLDLEVPRDRERNRLSVSCCLEPLQLVEGSVEGPVNLRLVASHLPETIPLGQILQYRIQACAHNVPLQIN